MALLAIDIVVSMIQAIVFSYSIEYCLQRENKINKSKLVLIGILIFIISICITSIWGNISICVFIIHIASLSVITILYKDYKLRALIPYTLIYCLMGIYAIIVSNLFFGLIKNLVAIDYVNMVQILTIYIPQILLIYLWLKYINKIKNLYNLIVSEKINMIVIIIVSFCIDFVVAFYSMIYNDESKLLKNIIITMLCIFLIFITKNFGEIKKKSNEIYELNKVLEIKNTELRKIKHDYGAQISYLYGLCLMERFDDLKQALKDIINKNENTATAVEINNNKNSLLSFALKPALDSGIHVIIKGDGDISLCKMSEMELYRVISNIVNNAIKAMNGKGIIITKVYEQLESLVIKIENNGPKIKEEYMEKIFQSGFTTKNNTDKSHGFGLSIVKELIENCGGKISLKSNDISTEFKIVLPRK